MTLIGDNAETLDAMSTTAFMMPIDRAAFFVKQIGAEAVFVSEAGDVFVTDGLRNGFELTGKGA